MYVTYQTGQIGQIVPKNKKRSQNQKFRPKRDFGHDLPYLPCSLLAVVPYFSSAVPCSNGAIIDTRTHPTMDIVSSLVPL